VPLHELVGLGPAAGQGVVDRGEQVGRDVHGIPAGYFTSCLNAFRTFSTFGSATALQ
jgi:hypothetical protein